MELMRYDRSTVPKVSETEEGYLRGEAIVTRVGVFEYLNGDGTKRLELRHPDDVFDPESLASLKMIPITVEHPTEAVDATNVERLSVGTTGENIRVEGGNIIAPLTITASRGKEAVSAGSEELSLGYKLDLMEESGTFQGKKYTHRQRNIRYNHLSIVKRGRAGKVARLNMDGVAVQSEEASMAKINFDGVDHEVSAEVAAAFSKSTAASSILQGRLDAQVEFHKKEIDALQGRLDAAEEAKKKAEKEKAEAEEASKAKNSDAAIDALVTQRLALLGSAKKLAPNLNTDGLSPRQVMEGAIKAASPSINFDGKTDEYVSAFFDATVNSVGGVSQMVAQAAGGSRGARVDSAPLSNADAAAEAEEAWTKSVADLNAWRTKG